MSEVSVRPSSIQTFIDCERRFAAHHMTSMVEAAGYTLAPPRRSHVGAIVGSGLHAVAEFTLQAKASSGILGGDTDAEDYGIAAAEERAREEGCDFDEATPDFNVAQKQLRRMSRSWRRVIAPKIASPLAIETRLEADLGDGFVLTGQPDIVTAAPESAVRDLKTNRVIRSPHAQLGAYALLLRAHDIDVGQLVQDHIPRLPMLKPQPDPVSVETDVVAAQNDAHEALMAIKRATQEFQRRVAASNGQPPTAAWRPNPASSLCNERWCRAFATDFCPVYRRGSSHAQEA